MQNGQNVTEIEYIFAGPGDGPVADGEKVQSKIKTYNLYAREHPLK